MSYSYFSISAPADNKLMIVHVGAPQKLVVCFITVITLKLVSQQRSYYGLPRNCLGQTWETSFLVSRIGSQAYINYIPYE